MAKLAEDGIDLGDGKWHRLVPACFHKGKREEQRCAVYLHVVRQELGQQQTEVPQQPEAIIAAHSLLVKERCKKSPMGGTSRRQKGRQR